MYNLFKQILIVDCLITRSIRHTVFSSPELKAQVSFSDRLSSVCLSVHLSVRPSVNFFSHFQLLLQNHWANFNTWHKASLGDWNSSLFKWRPSPSQNTLSIFKNLLLQNHWANFNQTWCKVSLSEGIPVCANKGPLPFLRGDNCEIVKIHWQFFR